MQAGGTVKITIRLSWLAAAVGVAAFLVATEHVETQSMMNGYWNPLGHQDNYNYGGGPDPGTSPVCRSPMRHEKPRSSTTRTSSRCLS